MRARFSWDSAANKVAASASRWHVMSSLPARGLVDVFAATIRDFPFRPQLHVNYAETVLPMRDGLPKMRDFPAEPGGSGEVIAE